MYLRDYCKILKAKYYHSLQMMPYQATCCSMQETHLMECYHSTEDKTVLLSVGPIAALSWQTGKLVAAEIQYGRQLENYRLYISDYPPWTKITNRDT